LIDYQIIGKELLLVFKTTHRVLFFNKLARRWWLMLVILATWESKNERITPGGQPGQIVLKIPSPK
jgi:hypothetical protein